MNYKGYDFWPSVFTKKALFFSILTSVGISIYFHQYLMPLGLLLVGITIIGMFFLGLNYYSIRWNKIRSQRVFETRLFWTSLFYRLLAVAYMYLLTLSIDPANFPMELAASDSWTYHSSAELLSKHNINEYGGLLPLIEKSSSDYGFNIYMSLIYKIFGPITLPIRIINCLLGSLTVVFISRIAGYLYSQKHARLTGVIAMIFPSLLWFTGMHLKETLMIFIFTTISYLVIKMYTRKKISINSILIILFFTVFLFYFRTFLAVIVIVSVLFFYTINSIKRLSLTTLILLFAFSFGSVIIIDRLNFFTDITNVYNESEDIFARQLAAESKRVKNISYKEAVVTPFIVAGSLITPFPSYLVTESRQIAIVAHFQNEIIRNFLYYFAILGLLIMLRKYRLKSSLILFFIFSYLYVITTAGTSFVDRFHLLLIPFLIISMSVGLIDSNRKWINKWNIYLIIIVIGQIAWTFFKINIRSL